MAIIGITTDKTNPNYTINDFTFWMPQFKNYMLTDDGITMFNNLYPIANAKIFYSIMGTDWKYAMSLCIAHYATIIARQTEAPSGSTLSEIAGGGVTKGMMSSASIGGFNANYALDKTIIDTDNAKWWNQTSYGADLMALYKTKAIPSIFVVTTHDEGIV